MSTRSGILRPRRGKRSTAISKGIILKRGEVFFEVPDTGVGTGSGKIVMGDGVSRYEDLPYYSEGGGGGTGTVQSVNNIKPDDKGNITLTTIPYAENILAPDNVETSDNYIFRTSGGGKDIESGEAYLNTIYGNCVEIEETIHVATPNKFKSTGLNQFDKSTMILANYAISTTGAVISSVGSYVAYVHAVGGLSAGYIAYDPNSSINKIGWCATAPTTTTEGIIIAADGTNVTSLSNNTTSAIIVNVNEGYICISCSNINDLTVHPRWSGTSDTETDGYVYYTIDIPTTDINGTPLPTASYGFPSVGAVRDEIDFDTKVYIKRIGYYNNTPANMAIVEELGVPFINDASSIFYVLPEPVTYKLAATVSPIYTVNDFGTEEFTNTTVPVYADNFYGQNLRDKLRRDVLTISAQSLSTSEKEQVLANIGAGKDATVIEYLDYMELTEEERLAGNWLVTNFPGATPMSSGVIPLDPEDTTNMNIWIESGEE